MLGLVLDMSHFRGNTGICESFEKHLLEGTTATLNRKCYVQLVLKLKSTIT